MGEEQVKWPSYHLAEPQNSASREQLLRAALAVGDRLESLALRDEKNASWVGLTLINQKHWTLASLGADLYDGLSGVILFLAYLGSVTKGKRYTTLAKTALTTMQRHGDLGNLDLLLQASLTLDEPKWRSQVNRLAAIILESINQHGWLCGVPLGVETPGLMTGLAGIGYELLRLAEPTCIPSVLTLAPPISFPRGRH